MGFQPGLVLAPLDQRYPDEIVAEALAMLQARRPEMVLRNGSPETVLAEVTSLAAADVIATGDAVVGGVVEALLANLYKVPRLPGAQAVGGVTVTFDSTVSPSIPAGTRLILTDYGVDLVTTAAATGTSVTSLVLQVATAEATAAVNGLGAATVDFVDPVPNALSAAVSSAFSGGADPESDEAYILRAGWRLARSSSSLTVPEHFAAWVLEDGRASNALAIRAWDGTGTAPTGLAGTHGGHVTVVAYGRGGQLPSGVRAELAAAMQAISAAGTTIHVNAAAVTTVPVTVSVVAEVGYDSVAVQDEVEATVRGYLSPESWPFGATMVRLALWDRITSIPSVAYVSALTAPAADVTLTADGSVIAGTVTVSVA